MILATHWSKARYNPGNELDLEKPGLPIVQLARASKPLDHKAPDTSITRGQGGQAASPEIGGRARTPKLELLPAEILMTAIF